MLPIAGTRQIFNLQRFRESAVSGSSQFLGPLLPNSAHLRSSFCCRLASFCTPFSSRFELDSTYDMVRRSYYQALDRPVATGTLSYPASAPLTSPFRHHIVPLDRSVSVNSAIPYPTIKTRVIVRGEQNSRNRDPESRCTCARIIALPVPLVSGSISLPKGAACGTSIFVIHMPAVCATYLQRSLVTMPHVSRIYPMVLSPAPWLTDLRLSRCVTMICEFSPLTSLQHGASLQDHICVIMRHLQRSI